MAAMLSAPFLTLVASSFCEAQRRQTRHLALSQAYQPRGESVDTSWQLSLPERLFGLSGLGLFRFDLFATSANGELLFVDESHPMVTHGRMAPPRADSAIAKLRAQFPDIPELHAHSLDMADGGDDALAHGVCSIAALATDALFYYRCPNNALPGAAVWILITEAVKTPPSVLPANLASLAPPREDFASYEAAVAAYDAARPAGQIARLNDFRVNLTSLLSVRFPHGVTMEALFKGFLSRNGYGTRETEHTSEEDEALVDVAVDLADDTSATPALTATFDALGRLRGIRMTLTADAYPADD